MLTDWVGGISGLLEFIVHFTAVVSLLMAIGSIAFREVPIPSDTISTWLRYRRYTTFAMAIIASARYLMRPNHEWLFISVATFILTNFLVTPLVERHNASSSNRER